jgi:hypothetical protein
MRRSTTGGSASTVTSHVASPVIAAATTPPAAPPANANVTITVTPAIHDTDASRQGGQHRNGQPELDPVGQNILGVQANQSFMEKIEGAQCRRVSLGLNSHRLSCPPGRISRRNETAKHQHTFFFDFHIQQNNAPATLPMAMG